MLVTNGSLTTYHKILQTQEIRRERAVNNEKKKAFTYCGYRYFDMCS